MTGSYYVDEAREQAEALAEQKRLEAEVQQRKAKKRGKLVAPQRDDFDGLDAVDSAKPEDEAWLLRQIGIPQGDTGGSKTGRSTALSDVDALADLSSQLRKSRSTEVEREGVVASAAPEVGIEALYPPVEEADLPAMPEVKEIEDPRPGEFSPRALESDLSVSLDTATPGVFEVDIAKALEEQERRVRMEEEARATLERAEIEAQHRAEREAREISEARERARKEAAARAREESERQAREDKERRELE